MPRHRYGYWYPSTWTPLSCTIPDSSICLHTMSIREREEREQFRNHTARWLVSVSQTRQEGAMFARLLLSCFDDGGRYVSAASRTPTVAPKGLRPRRRHLARVSRVYHPACSPLTPPTPTIALYVLAARNPATRRPPTRSAALLRRSCSSGCMLLNRPICICPVFGCRRRYRSLSPCTPRSFNIDD